MDQFAHLADRGLFAKEFLDEIQHLWFRRSRILILVDGRISVLSNSPDGISTAFGISTVIATLKGFSEGFSSFDVTVATRNGAGEPPGGHDIAGFRFSDATLAEFDQVWMFGINPGNIAPNNLDPTTDLEIKLPVYNPLSQAELAALAKWMDRGGGVFATGDHHFLGASMCHKVPRVGTMRRWTIADGVPTIEHATRYDTNRPVTHGQKTGTSVIPGNVEEDAEPQDIEWVPYATVRQSISTIRRRPHPLLCHPTYGPIDILPDHPHEGLCYDFEQESWWSGMLDRSFSFEDYSNDEYPKESVFKQPLPKVVAWGTTLADPPLMHAKGDQPQRRFPQIAAYDGSPIGIGRVVVDSTWHHWFDMNLAGIEARAREYQDRTDIDRILRYYINVGLYLASTNFRAGPVLGVIKAAQFGYFGQQEFDPRASAVELGRITAAYFTPILGACWVSEFVFDSTGLVSPEIGGWLREKIGKPNPGLSSPSVDLFEQAVLGEIVRAAYADMDDLTAQLNTDGKIRKSPLLRTLDETVPGATRAGLQAAFDAHRADLERGQEEMDLLERALASPPAAAY